MESLNADHLVQFLVLHNCIAPLDMNMKKYVELFQSHGITGATVADLSEDEMIKLFESIGVEDAKVTKFVQAISGARNEPMTEQQLREIRSLQVYHDIKVMGDQYADAAEIVSDANIDGNVICDSTSDQLHELLITHGLTNVVQRTVVVSRLIAIKKNYTAKANEAGTVTLDIPDMATIAPRDCLARIFQIQGIRLDPDDIDVAADRVASAIGANKVDPNSDEYDCFLSYRVASDKTVADALYTRLVIRGLKPFLDKVCLVTGMDWKDGFLQGLHKSRRFVPLVSRGALANFRDFGRDHRRDNVLLEYETALQMMDRRKDPSFIVPVLVGEVENANLAKFNDFAADLYAPSVQPS